MKNVLAVAFILLCCSFVSYSQQIVGSTERYFAQGLVLLDNEDLILALQSELRSNSYFEVVRVDRLSKRFFLLFDSSENVSDIDVRNWFAQHDVEISCIQIGVHGVDQVNSYPFQNCSE